MLILLYLSYIFTLIGYLKIWNLWYHILVKTLIIDQNDAELPLIFRIETLATLSTYHLHRKTKNSRGKSNGSHHYLLESSENGGFVLRRYDFLLLSDFSPDFEILFSGLFPHHNKF